MAENNSKTDWLERKNQLVFGGWFLKDNKLLKRLTLPLFAGFRKLKAAHGLARGDGKFSVFPKISRIRFGLLKNR